MNIKEKASRYDEVLNRAKITLDCCGSTSIATKNAVYDIFPELREPEDEKVRKAILELVKQSSEILDKQNQNNMINWLEKQDKEKSWKPSKEEMDVLYGLAYITNQYDEHKEEVITRLYQDLKREFFNGSSYENMFPNTSTEDDVRRRSTIQVLEYARSLDAYNQYGKADIDKNIAWLEKQGKETSEKEFTFKALPRLLEMIEVSDRAKAYTEKLAVALDNEGYHTDAKIVRESIKIMNGEEVPMATMDEQKPVDNIEPKFKVGDWVVEHATNRPVQIVRYEERSDGTLVWFNNGTGIYVDFLCGYHLWTIQDAKDGDVLATPNYIYIFNSIDKETETVAFYCLIKKSDKHFSFGDYRIHDEILNSTPATKKQYDILIKAMTDSGYTFNFEKKELKKIKQKSYGQRKECLDCQFNYVGECKGSCAMKRSEQKSQRMVSAEAKEAIYDKPTDEEMKELLRTEYEKGRADVITEMKSSWSEEDEKSYVSILNDLKQNVIPDEDDINWLKSLKDRYTWKPSNEQIEAFEHFVRSIGESSYASPYDNNTKLLYSLLEQLKKLKA